MSEWPAVPTEREVPVGLQRSIMSAVAADAAQSRGSAPPSPRPIRQAPQRRRRRRPLLLIGVAAVLVVVLVAIALPSLLPQGAPLGPSPVSASALLHEAADASGSTTPVGPGEFRYIKVENQVQYTAFVDQDSFTMLLPHEAEYWISPDQPGLERSSTGRARFATEADRQAWIDLGRPDMLPPEHSQERELPPGALVDESLSKLSSDPAVALQQFREGRFGDVDDDADVLYRIGEKLTTSATDPATPELLYRTAALIPGIEVIEGASDRSGRQGTGVALESDAGTRVLVFEPESGRFLEAASYEMGATVGIDEPTTWNTLLADGVSPASGETP